MKTIKRKLTYTIMRVSTNGVVHEIVYPGDWNALTNAKRGKWMDANNIDSIESVDVVTKKHEMPIVTFIELSAETN